MTDQPPIHEYSSNDPGYFEVVKTIGKVFENSDGDALLELGNLVNIQTIVDNDGVEHSGILKLTNPIPGVPDLLVTTNPGVFLPVVHETNIPEANFNKSFEGLSFELAAMMTRALGIEGPRSDQNFPGLVGSTTGPEWRRMSQKVYQYTKPETLKSHNYINKTTQLAHSILNELEDGEEITLHSLTDEFALAAVTQGVFGVDFYGLLDKAELSMQDIANAIHHKQNQSVAASLNPFKVQLRQWFNQPLKSIEDDMVTITKLVSTAITMSEKTRSDRESQGLQKTLIDELSDQMRTFIKTDGNEGMSPLRVNMILQEMIEAGYGTASKNIQFAIVEMSKNPAFRQQLETLMSKEDEVPLGNMHELASWIELYRGSLLPNSVIGLIPRGAQRNLNLREIPRVEKFHGVPNIDIKKGTTLIFLFHETLKNLHAQTAQRLQEIGIDPNGADQLAVIDIAKSGGIFSGGIRGCGGEHIGATNIYVGIKAILEQGIVFQDIPENPENALVGGLFMPVESLDSDKLGLRVKVRKGMREA